jgi:hypothetical protein
MVFNVEDFLVLEVILQGSAVELLQYQVEFDGEDADQHILSFVTETEAISAVQRKPELPGIYIPKVELGKEGKRKFQSLWSTVQESQGQKPLHQEIMIDSFMAGRLPKCPVSEGILWL